MSTTRETESEPTKDPSRKARVADAAREAAAIAEDVAEQIDKAAATAREAVSEGAERVVREAHEAGLDDVLRSVTGFARRHPEAALATGMVIGFVVARLLRPTPNA